MSGSSVVENPLLNAVALVDQAIEGRQSIRAFTGEPVPRGLIEEILAVASRAPSGANIQPWKAYVLQGASKDALVEKVCAAYDAIRDHPEQAAQYVEAFDYYPRKWVSPFIERRRQNGWGLYGLLGIERGNKDGMHAQHRRNFRYFDAPVGLIFTISTVLSTGSLMDYGGYIQSVMIAARARGLDTCPQAAWNAYGKIVLPHIGAGDDEMIVCGMSLGYADESALVNTFRTPRLPVSDFTVWLD